MDADGQNGRSARRTSFWPSCFSLLNPPSDARLSAGICSNFRRRAAKRSFAYATARRFHACSLSDEIAPVDVSGYGLIENPSSGSVINIDMDGDER
jgi:hypothetical protein